MIRPLLLATACLASYAVAISPRAVSQGTARGEDITHLLAPVIRAEPAPSVSYDRAGTSTRKKSLSPADLSMLTRTLVGEGARQSDAELRAIAHVVFNRVRSGLWGRSVASVVLHQEQRPSGRWTYAFTAFDPAHNAGRNVWGRKIEKTRAWARARRIAQEAWHEPDPTQGSLYYFHAKSMKPAGSIPRWAVGKEWVQIGEATFVKGVGK